MVRLSALMMWAALLLGVSMASAQENSGAVERYEELVAAWKKNERGKPHPDFEGYAPRFLELARRDPSGPVAKDALLWIIGQMGNYAALDGPVAEINNEAMEILADNHADDPIVGAAGMRIINMPTPGRERFLRRLVERSRNREARGRALLALAEYLKMKSRIARGAPLKPEERERTNIVEPYLLDIVASDPAPLRREAERVFEEVAADYADVLFIGGGRPERIEYYKKKGDTLGAMAERSLFELRSLQVGQPAPEIVGADSEGKTFRLSDYRGKVVVLTFSGNWCGPCVRMYPGERRLVERLKDRPFALLSVNTDATVETLREAIAKEEITWRCWWDGEPGGPIASRWNIQGYPSVFVIDHKGIIRYNKMDESGLEEAVEGLLSKLE